jgi:type II restriction enzyme
MNNLLPSTIQSCSESTIAFSKFITANDVGATGGHQAGFHIHKHSWSLFFDSPGVQGSNKDIFIKIKWQGDFETDSRCIYYGVGTRNEYRLTRFGRRFPFLKEDNVGDLLVISKKGADYYEAFVLSDDLDIEGFFSAFGISSTETNGILPKLNISTAEEILQELFNNFIERLTVDFPPTIDLATGAREIFLKAYHQTYDSVLKQPDKDILNWLSTEFNLFKAIENDRYRDYITTPINSVDDLIKIANTILNRRKSRAGKSLEHHLSKVFKIWNISFTSQATTEVNKKPDFIFPSIEQYFKEPIGSDKLVFLGAKTTCKDRWRQIVGEADRIPHKYLFTLQQGISANQLKEMKTEGVSLVVPKPYLTSFPKEYRADIWTLDKFVHYVRETQM